MKKLILYSYFPRPPKLMNTVAIEKGKNVSCLTNHTVQNKKKYLEGSRILRGYVVFKFAVSLSYRKATKKVVRRVRSGDLIVFFLSPPTECFLFYT